MPYYKKIDYGKKAIQSVINQSYKKFELLIIYDDENLEDYHKIKKFIGNNKKIKIIINNKNLGAGYSRNIGIRHSNGNIISFIDSDDTWNSQKLKKQLYFMNKNNYAFTFCGYKKIFDKKSINVKSNSAYLGYNDLLKSCEIGLSTVMLKKKIINSHLFSNLKTQEDFAAWLKITKNNKAFFLNELLVNWYSTENSLSSDFKQKIKDAYRVYHIHQKFSKIKSIYYLLILSINSIKRKI